MGENTLNDSKELSQFEEELQKFPPSLRKLAKFIANSEDFISISESARQAGLDPKHILNIISIYRRKGKSFNNFIRDTLFEKMASFRPSIMASVIREAQKGSYRHAELYFRLMGDLRSEPRNEGNTTTNNLTFVLAMPRSIEPVNTAIPEHNSGEDHGVIDVESVRDTEADSTKLEVVYQCPFCGGSFERLNMLGEHITEEHKTE